MFAILLNIAWISLGKHILGLVFISIFLNKTTQLHLTSGIHKNMLSHLRPRHPMKIQPVTPDNFEVCEYTNLTFTHAESPVWDPDSRTLFWVDVLNQDVHALDYVTLKHRVKHIDLGEVNMVIPVANSKQLVIGCLSQVFLMDWNRKGKAALHLIADLDPSKQKRILNEGKADGLGRLWAGTKGPQLGDMVAPNEGALYVIERPHFEPKIQLRPVTLSNGLTWALNNSVFYYIDSATNRIDAFDFNLLKGQIWNRRMILNITEWGFKNTIPDGMTIDRDGFLWVALYLNGSVIRIDPDARQIVQVYQLPVSRTTSMTWAGEQLEDLVVTTSRRNLVQQVVDAAPLSGTIFILRQLGTGGVPDNKFIYRTPHKN